eukprot:SAG31_NODE_2428_length_5715_cov_6.736111_5_plen_228_part_00
MWKDLLRCINRYGRGTKFTVNLVASKAQWVPYCFEERGYLRSGCSKQMPQTRAVYSSSLLTACVPKRFIHIPNHYTFGAINTWGSFWRKSQPKTFIEPADLSRNEYTICQPYNFSQAGRRRCKHLFRPLRSHHCKATSRRLCLGHLVVLGVLAVASSLICRRQEKMWCCTHAAVVPISYHRRYRDGHQTRTQADLDQVGQTFCEQEHANDHAYRSIGLHQQHTPKLS